MTISGAFAGDAAKEDAQRDNQVTFADCAPLEKYKTEINNTQTDNSKDLNIVMPVYNIGIQQHF